MKNPEKNPLADLEVPRARTELRSRVVDAASLALLDPGAGETFWDRMRESRAARGAWLATMTVVFVAHGYLSLPADAGHSLSAGVESPSESGELDEVLPIPNVGSTDEFQSWLIARGAEDPEEVKTTSSGGTPS